MMCPLQLTMKASSPFPEVIWKQKAPNSEYSQLPLLIQMGKESVENCQSLSLFEADIKKLADVGVQVDSGTGKVKVVAASLDRKASNIYYGLGGGYCDLCSISKKDCTDPKVITEGFKIDRNVDNLHSIYEKLVNEAGEVQKRPDDYEGRQGVTTKPIATTSIPSGQVLYAVLRTNDQFMKVVVHLGAGVEKWSEAKHLATSRFLDAQKRRLQEVLMDAHAIKWDYVDSTGQGGSTTTGNVARKLLHNPAVRETVVSFIDIPEKKEFSRALSYLESDV